MRNKTNSGRHKKKDAETRTPQPLDQQSSRECTVCDIKCVSDKYFVEHLWSLTHHIKVNQVQKWEPHVCGICKISYKTIKEYGDHLALQTHRAARGRFYSELESGKTVKDLVKSNVIIMPRSRVNSRAKSRLPKDPSRENYYSNNARSAASKFSQDSNDNFSFDHSSYYEIQDTYDYFGQEQQNYNESNFYHQSQHYCRKQWIGSQPPFYLDYGCKDYCQTSRPYQDTNNINSNEQMPHNQNYVTNSEPFRYPCNSYTKSIGRSTGKKRLISTKGPNQRNHPGNPGMPQAHNDSKHNKKANSSLVKHDVNNSSKASKLVDKDCITSESSTVPGDGVSRRKNSEDRKDASGSRELSSDSNVNPPDDVCDEGIITSTTQVSLSLADTLDDKKEIVKENISKLVNLSCSRKQKLMLQKLMKEYGRTQAKSPINRLGQSLLSLVEESLASDVMSSLSSVRLPCSSNQATAEQIDSTLLPEDVLGQIMKFLTESNLYTERQENDDNRQENPGCSLLNKGENCYERTKENDSQLSMSKEDAPLNTTEVQEISLNRKTKPSKTKDCGNSIELRYSNSRGNTEECGIIDDIEVGDGISDVFILENCDSISSEAYMQNSTKEKRQRPRNINKQRLPMPITHSPSPSKNRKNSKQGNSKVYDISSNVITPEIINIMDDDFTTGKANFIKQEVFDEIILEGEKVLRLNEHAEVRVKQEVEDVPASSAPCDQSVAVNTTQCPLQEPAVEHFANRVAISPLSYQEHQGLNSPSLIGPTSLAVHALDLAIEQENIQSQIQVLLKQLTKMQAVLATLQDRERQVQLQRSDMMKYLSKSVEGRKQMANLSRIISEIPKDDVQSVSSPNSCLTAEVASSPRPVNSYSNSTQVEGLDKSPSLIGAVEPRRTNAGQVVERNEGLDKSPLLIGAVEPRRTNAGQVVERNEGEASVGTKVRKKKGEKRQKSESENVSTTVKRQKSESEDVSTTEKRQKSESEDVSTTEKRKKPKLKEQLQLSSDKKQQKDKNSKKVKKSPSCQKESKIAQPCIKDSPKLMVKMGKKVVLNFIGHVDRILKLVGTTKMLYSISSDGTARKFKLKGTTCKCLTTFTHQSEIIVGMEIITTVKEEIPNCLVIANSKGVVKKFDLETGECLSSFKTENTITCMTYRWGCIFIGFSDGSLSRMAIKNSKSLGVFHCSTKSLTCLSATVEGAYRILCVGAEDRSVTIREAHSGLLIRHFNLEREYPKKIQVVNSVAFTLGYGDNVNNAVYMHNFTNGELLCSVNTTTNISCMHVTDHQLLMLGCSDGLIRIMDPKSKQLKQLYYGAGCRMITSITCWEEWLISGNDEGKIEACKMVLNHSHLCKYGRCPGKFAYYEDLVFHVKHVHASTSFYKCLVSECQHSFTGDNSCTEKITQHILSHSSFAVEVE